MLYAGVDHHKRYSHIEVVDAAGQPRASVRLGNEVGQLQRFFRSLGEPCCAVLEAGRNWGVMYDALETVADVSRVELAHPYRVRAIAAAQVKTDAIDARTLAQLLRVDLIPRAYIPARETRRLREVVRQRLFLVRLRTMVKNRIHTLLDCHHVSLPAVSDLFGKRGRQFLAQVVLPAGAQPLLQQDLAVLDTLGQEIRATEQWLRQALRDDERVQRLKTIPGLGQLLATVVALEIDRIDRFPSAAKLAAYAGLVPTTRASGGRTTHGRLMTQRNKWLQWAAVEAAWSAIRCDPYFRTHFRRRRHKGTHTAIIAVARRLLEVVWHIWRDDRSYEHRLPHAGYPAALKTP